MLFLTKKKSEHKQRFSHSSLKKLFLVFFL